MNDLDRLDLSPTLADELEREMHAPEPPPPPPPAGEPPQIKRRRLLDLDEAMARPVGRVAAQLEHAEYIGGKIFDLPPLFLDQVARLALNSRRSKDIAAAQNQIDRSDR